MKVGDLVIPINNALTIEQFEEDWTGIIIDWDGVNPIVYWNEKFPDEAEYTSQLEVLSESR